MRVALLTNFIPPYRLPLFEALERGAGEMRVFVSTTMESNRGWPVNWGTLDVAKQHTITVRRTWRTSEFAEAAELHVPYDTFVQLRRYRPDVIVTGEMGARSVQATMYGMLTGTPVILWATLSERTEEGRGNLRRLARRWLIRNVAAVIVNGESGARYVSALGVADKKVIRVPYTTDMSALLNLPIEGVTGGDLQLLYVGSLTERKGLGPLMDVLERYATAHSQRRLTLELVGDGPLRAQLLARTRPANLTVECTGPVPYAELSKAYARAHIFVFPSLSDEWGMVVNEALAAGLPVLGSVYSQAVDELIVDNVNGWRFEPKHAAAIAAAVDRALSTDATTLQRMRVAARGSVQDLTPDAAATQMLACMQQVSAR